MFVERPLTYTISPPVGLTPSLRLGHGGHYLYVGMGPKSSLYSVNLHADQAILMDVRNKDMTNNITITMTFMMLEPPNCSPSVCDADFQLSGGVYLHSGSVYQLSGNGISTRYPLKYQLSQCFLTQKFNPERAN